MSRTALQKLNAVGARRRAGSPFDRLLTECAHSTAVADDIYQGLRRLILNGILETGCRLPSSRALAEQLDVSRGSVSSAMDRLGADGWLRTRRGSGSYVSYQGRHVVEATDSRISPAGHVPAVPFALGVAPVDLFPKAVWSRLQSRRWRSISSSDLQEGGSMAVPGLQEAIAGYLAARRGLAVLPAQIVVSSCIPALIDLMIRSLGLIGCEAWVETPSYPGWWRALRNCNVRVRAIPVDRFGLDVSAAISAAPSAGLAVIAPNNQFPTGVVMSAARRGELLAWADARDSWIVEDDFDWQQAGSSAPGPLVRMDQDRVIYCDTFNHILFPSLRIAYAVVPVSLLDRVAATRKGIDGSMNVPVQMTLADFISGGHLDRHLMRVQDCGAESGAALVHLLQHDLSDIFTSTKAAGAHHICQSRVPLSRLLSAARDSRVILETMADFRLVAQPADDVLLGHFGFTAAALTKAAAIFRAAVLSCSPA